MDILPGEVESVRTIGTLFDDDVKMVKTRGGFHVAVGRKKKRTRKSEALAAGSHEAIVAHQLSKEYGSDFRPAIFKSESERLEDVENKTEYLPREAIQRGVELYTLSKGNRVQFILYKHGMTLGEYDTEISQGSLVIKSYKFKNDLIKSDKETAEALSRAIREKMEEHSLSKVEKGTL